MAYYHLQRLGDVDGNSYWVDARSEEYARRLVAMLVQEAADAKKVELFDCRLSSIQRRAGSVVRRQAVRQRNLVWER
jgi:hypothetical protein